MCPALKSTPAAPPTGFWAGQFCLCCCPARGHPGVFPHWAVPALACWSPPGVGSLPCTVPLPTADWEGRWWRLILACVPPGSLPCVWSGLWGGRRPPCQAGVKGAEEPDAPLRGIQGHPLAFGGPICECSTAGRGGGGSPISTCRTAWKDPSPVGGGGPSHHLFLALWDELGPGTLTKEELLRVPSNSQPRAACGGGQLDMQGQLERRDSGDRKDNPAQASCAGPRRLSWTDGQTFPLPRIKHSVGLCCLCTSFPIASDGVHPGVYEGGWMWPWLRAEV